MKKNRTNLYRDFFIPLQRYLRIMKLTFIFILFGLMTYASTLYSQDKRLTFELKNATIENVFKQIESLSEYKFAYNSTKLDVGKKISLKIDNQTIDVILDKILKTANLQYRIVDRYIIITDEAEQNVNLIGIDQSTKKVTGKVTDASGAFLPGVSVVVKGTTNGTITDSNGNYSISNIPEKGILQFSFVGMKTQEVPVAGKTTVNVSLTDESIGIEEVVAIGYGTRKKSDLTGAITQISSDKLQTEVKMSPELAMQGKMAGVYISNTGSDPNTRPTVQIRGVSTMGFNDPLYVIDGIPIYEYGAYGGGGSDANRIADLRGTINILNMINPDDIESISVLKDASATAIYGVRASNGVILITTKRGSQGKITTTYSSKYGVQNINKRYDVLNVKDYVALMNEGWKNNPAYTPDAKVSRYYDPASQYYLGNLPQSDWMDKAVVKNAVVQDHNINVSGGNSVSNYSVGAGYSSQDNAMFTSKFDRYSFFLNSDHKLNKWLKIGESYRFVYSKSKLPKGGSQVSFSDMTFTPPWQPLYDSAGLYGLALPGRTVNGEFISQGYGAGTRSNFLGTDLTNKNTAALFRNLGTFYAEVTPLSGLRIRGTFSFDRYSRQLEGYNEEVSGLFDANSGVLTGNGNTYGRRRTVNSNMVKEFLIGYNRTFGKHNFDLVLNATDQKMKWEVDDLSIITGSTIPSWDQRLIKEGLPSADKSGFYEWVESGLQGYMGRLSYNFNSKYYLDATIRRDGTSRFAPGYKWGTFPSFAAAWRISSESFMQGIAWLNDLKIRTGWGKTGNQETGNFAYLSLINTSPKYALGSTTGNGTINSASALLNFPVNDLTWETVTTSNLGFDAILFDNKLTVTAEYYHRHTDGILQTIDIPLVVGVRDNPTVNLAKVNNSGFEFQASYADKIGKLGYNVSFNLTTVKNRVEKMYLDKPTTNGYLRIEEGKSMNYIYGYKMNGIFQSTEEVTAFKSKYSDTGYDDQKSPGDIGFKDLYGAPAANAAANVYKSDKPDGTIDSYDQTYLGKTIPGFFYGLNIGLNYENWDLSLNFRGVGDVQKINYVKWAGESMNSGGVNQLASTLGRWTSTNHSTKMPRAVANDPTGNTRFSDRWVEDAGFLRLQNLQVGYNFKGAVLKKCGLSSLRCFLSGSNLFVITPYSGLDPEDDSTPVTYMVGVNLNF